ncbi:MAG: aspartate aminotransferase family protein [Clostridiales bacterium]|nr:aspartate aminotransferase family protein [Clostridiales bacterium]
MDFKEIKESDAKNYLTVFNRQTLCFTHGKGSKLYDTAGNEYIDMGGGIAVNCLGHDHPALTAAICEQAHKLIHVSNLYYNEPQAVLCENLLNGTIFDRMFLCNSGAEANEGAIKLIRKYFYNKGEARAKIVTARNSFHGRTLATVTATGQEKYSRPFAPLPAGFAHVPYNDFAALKDEADDNTAAIILEMIQGESGVLPADYDYIVNAYALAKSRGILFAVDEVQTGMGRTGKMFAFEHYGIQPDIVTLAKGLGGGVPIGAVLARGDIATAFAPGDHGTTFGGNPLACAAANVVTNLLKNGLLEEVAQKGEYLLGRLSKLKKFNFVRDVRGKGLLLGIQLGDKVKNTEIVGKMAASGVLLITAGNNTLRLAPAYTVTKEEMDEACDKLMDLFARTNV